MTVKQDLQNAAAAIRQLGWWQASGSTYEPSRPMSVCAVMALDVVTGFDRSRCHDATDALAAHLRLSSDNHPYGAVVDWNDAPGRTAEEVIAAFEAAAEAQP